MPNEFYKYLGEPNPFEIKFDPNSREAADAVANILGDPTRSLAPVLGVEVSVVDNGDSFDTSRFPLPPYNRYSVKVGDAKPVLVGDIVGWFNNDNPERLRIDLNEVGIETLGPPPLPSPKDANVAYQSAYIFDPMALDPGPIPNWLLGLAAKNRKAAAAKAAKK